MSDQWDIEGLKRHILKEAEKQYQHLVDEVFDRFHGQDVETIRAELSRRLEGYPSPAGWAEAIAEGRRIKIDLREQQ